MLVRRKRRLFAIVTGILLLVASGISTAHAQGSVDFSGTWNTITGKGKKIVITMQSVRRTTVTGTYARNGLTASYRLSDGPVTAFVKVSAIRGESALQSVSSITGTVTGNVLRFKWLEDGGRGAGRFTMSSDGQSFQGTFSLTDNSDDMSGGTWNGTRAPNFHGVWQTTVGGKVQFPQLLLQQVNNRVTGHLFGGRPELGVIKDGIIEGYTLRFQVWRATNPLRPDLYDQFIGIGELVMDKGGSKSFTGTILGAVTSGTRLGGR